MKASTLARTAAPTHDQQEIIAGLKRPQKQISPKYFYDKAGSELFEAICDQPEYYPTRTELGIMEQHIDQISDLIGHKASLIEFGSGASVKTRLILERAHELAAYVPVDISGQQLMDTAEALAADFPKIEVLPVCADFTRPFELPTPTVMPTRNIVYFPGSTIGNLANEQAVALLQNMRHQAKDEGGLLIGVDLEKPREILEPAYNDAAGVTAEFNLNMLTHLNREHGANFEEASFTHEAIFDEQKSRIEMRLISLRRQTVDIADESFEIKDGEYIVTEHSHKYSPDRFESMAGQAGFEAQEFWTDAEKLFSVQYLTAA
jgi:L-histidine N-alpha-methyltransferase